jgi:hypothetical protein
VQKWIDCAVLRRKFTIEIAMRVVEQGVVLRMQQDDLDRSAFQSFERRLRAVFSPGFEEKSAGVSA